MKRWLKADEWVKYASCGGSVDHTLPPARDEESADKPVADVEAVRSVCGRCRVRPECIAWAVGPAAPIGVWVAGRYIPTDKRQAKKVRQELTDYLELEQILRGDDV